MRRFLIVIILFSLVSCKYNKLLKSKDHELQYRYAMQFYEKKDYLKATELFDLVMPFMRTTDKAVEILYRYAYAYFELNDYELAGYYFNNFAKTFPNNEKTEEAEYMTAYCYFLDSPRSTLDQDNTYAAISEFQNFLSKHPESGKKELCLNFIKILNEKLMEKSFKNAKTYFDLEQYKAAVVALKNVLKEFPETPKREQVLFLILKSSYKFASNSLEIKQNERFKQVIKNYNTFINEFPDSPDRKEADRMYEQAKKSTKI